MGQDLEGDTEDQEAEAEDRGVEEGDQGVKIGTEGGTTDVLDQDQDQPGGHLDQDPGKGKGLKNGSPKLSRLRLELPLLQRKVQARQVTLLKVIKKKEELLGTDQNTETRKPIAAKI